VTTTTVTILSTDDLTASQRESVIDVCVAAHDNEEFRNLFTFVPSGGRHFLGYRGPKLVSHAVVTTRWLEVDGPPPLRTAFVDAVSTVPELQGQGCGTTLMRALAAGIPDFDIGCLQTDRAGFYERLGWELWRGALAGRGPNGLIPTPDQRGVMVLPLARTPPLDLAGLLTIEVQPARLGE
jgi:aminoglycoside 2'-N-acetyltransferase I